MSTVLFNHPYEDAYDKGIVIPLRIEGRHSGANVIYRIVGDESEKVMSLKSWEKYCRPIMFDTEEGA